MNYILVIFPDLYVALLTYKFDVPTLDMYFTLIVYCIAFKLQTLCYYLIVLTCKGHTAKGAPVFLNNGTR